MTNSPWISVNDRLPEDDKPVLLGWEGEPGYDLGYYSQPLKRFVETPNGCLRNNTHWMPLPDPPKPEDTFRAWWNGLRESVATGERSVSNDLWAHEDVARIIWNAAIASQKTDKQQP